MPILTASDAHLPQNVGLYIEEMNNLIQAIDASARRGYVEKFKMVGR